VIIVAHENAEEEILEEDKEHQWISERNIALPEVTFEEEMTISIGGKTVNLVHLGPGHSNSLIAVQFLEDKTVSIVDAANIGQVAYKTLGRPVKGYITQLKKARELEFDVVVPGHANIGTRADLDIYIDYLTTLVAQVEAAIAQGMSLEETQQSIDMERFNTLKRWDEWYLLNVQGVYEQLKEGEAG
jgi:glyoxylase-like metal-dependent hydrolase (beta-lactamase superfamily II)